MARQAAHGVPPPRASVSRLTCFGVGAQTGSRPAARTDRTCRETASGRPTTTPGPGPGPGCVLLRARPRGPARPQPPEAGSVRVEGCERAVVRPLVGRRPDPGQRGPDQVHWCVPSLSPPSPFAHPPAHPPAGESSVFSIFLPHGMQWIIEKVGKMHFYDPLARTGALGPYANPLENVLEDVPGCRSLSNNVETTLPARHVVRKYVNGGSLQNCMAYTGGREGKRKGSSHAGGRPQITLTASTARPPSSTARRSTSNCAPSTSPALARPPHGCWHSI